MPLLVGLGEFGTGTWMLAHVTVEVPGLAQATMQGTSDIGHNHVVPLVYHARWG